MRQVGDDELVNIIQSAMRGWSPSLYKLLTHHDHGQKLKGRLIAAGIIRDKLARYEVLTDTPPPPPFGYPDLGIRAEKLDEDHVPAGSPWASVGEG